MHKNLQEPIADDVFASYNFGEGVRVIEHDHWTVDSFDGADDWVKVAYVETDEDEPDQASHKISFHVKFKQGSPELIDAYGYWCETGAEI